MFYGCKITYNVFTMQSLFMRILMLYYCVYGMRHFVHHDICSAYSEKYYIFYAVNFIYFVMFLSLMFFLYD